VSFDGNASEGAQYLDGVIGRMADDGFKPLTIAFKDYTLADYIPLQQEYFNFESEESRNILESGLCHVASFSFSDELRKDARTILDKLRASDTNVRILSGDHKNCVIRVLRDLGITGEEENPNVMSNEELSNVMQDMFTVAKDGDREFLDFKDIEKEQEFK